MARGFLLISINLPCDQYSYVMMFRAVVVVIIRFELPIAKQIQHDGVFVLVVSDYVIVLQLHPLDQDYIYRIIDAVILKYLINLPNKQRTIILVDVT
jgi:hypothetical protein